MNNNNPVATIIASQEELKEMLGDLKEQVAINATQISSMLERQNVFLETLKELTQQLGELQEREVNRNFTSNSYNHSHNNNNNSNNNNVVYNNYESLLDEKFSKDDAKEVNKFLNSVINEITMTSYCVSKRFEELLIVR